MRVPLWRTRCCAALVVVNVWAWSATVSDYAKSLRYKPLTKSGVTTTASLRSYSYDPDGGDPGGWTTDQVSFVTRSGKRETATVGHHNPGTEQTTGTLPITYAPQHPEVVIAANADVAPTDGSEWWGGLLIGLPATFGALALGAWVVIGVRKDRAG